MHYARPNLLAPVLSYQLSWQTLNPDLHSGVFFLNYTWCSASSYTFCLHVQEKPQPSIPWVHLQVVISTSSLVPLLRGWEPTVAHTGSRMSLCMYYSLSASLSILVKLVWFYLHFLFLSLTTCFSHHCFTKVILLMGKLQQFPCFLSWSFSSFLGFATAFRTKFELVSKIFKAFYLCLLLISSPCYIVISPL